MSSDIRKKLEKYYYKIDKLAVKGKDKIFDYYKLIDEFIDKGEFDSFSQTLYYYYEIDTSIYNGDIPKLKTKTWDVILFQTNSSFQKKLKVLYDSKMYINKDLIFIVILYRLWDFKYHYHYQ